MTLEQALANIEQALASIQATKQVHAALDQSISVVKLALSAQQESTNAKEA